MKPHLFFQRIGHALRAFRSASAGNVAITFAIASLPIVGSVGFAVDYSHANSVKAAFQAALDSTALMLSKEASTDTSSQLQTNALKYFNALFTRPEAQSVSITVSYTVTGGSQVVVNGTAQVPTTFLGIVGYQNITIGGSSTAKWGSSRLRVALVLDNTGSMADNGKITALKTATKNLLSQLQNAAGTNGDVYVSIIPFSDDVNIGSSNYTASYLDWTDWDAENTVCAGNSRRGRGNNCNKSANHNTWNGCVTDRGGTNAPDSNNYDQKVTAPGSSAASKFPADQSAYCPASIMGLSYNWASMNSLVDSMSPAGPTNQPIGLVWGWQSLVGGGPLTAPAMDSNYTYQQIIILLSDGLNTQDRWYGDGYSLGTPDDQKIDYRMNNSTGQGTCANIKASGITIYTIQVNTGGDPTSTLLQNCASTSDKFFMLTSSSAIVTTFTAIGTNLTKLRVAK